MTYKEIIQKHYNNAGICISDSQAISLSFNEWLIKATFHNEYELVVQLIDSDDFDEAIIHDIGILDTPFPIYYISMCYKQSLEEDFVESIMPWIEKLRTDVDKLLKLWEDRFYIDIHAQIDYKNYAKYFYCNSDDDSEEDILLDPRKHFCENGCRDIDLDLFIAVSRFKFNEVKEILENGANPNANLLPITDVGKYDDDSLNCMDRIGGESSYLWTCEISMQLKLMYEDWYINRNISDEDLGNLIGLAAHKRMWKLLKDCP
jgi:hypothetical protein